MPEIVFLSGARTPFGTFGGTLKDTTSIDLAVVASRAALERSGVAPTDVSQAIFGSVIPTTADKMQQIWGARLEKLKEIAPPQVKGR